MNQKSDLLSVDTIIAKSQDKGAQILIEDSKRDYYSFFKNKQDGTQTAAFTTFQQFRIGEPVTIVFKNVPYKGKSLRSVVKFRAQEAGRPSTGPTHEAIARWVQANHPQVWTKMVDAFNKHTPNTPPPAPVNPTSGDDINVEDIPF